MADKVYPDSHTGITADLLRKSRRHMVTDSTTINGATLVPESPGSASYVIGDQITVAFDDTSHSPTFSGTSPSWFDKSSGEILEPGLYMGWWSFTADVNPTTAHLPVSYRLNLDAAFRVVDAELIFNSLSVPVDEPPDMTAFGSGDLPWSIATGAYVQAPSDATGSILATYNLRRLLAG